MPKNPTLLIRNALADVTLADLFTMRTLALQVVESDPHQVREDAFTAALFAAHARRAAVAAEVAQVEIRMRLQLALMDGTEGDHHLSPTAAESAAGRHRQYLSAKLATADAVMVAETAAAIARDLVALSGLHGPHPAPALSLAAA